MIRLRRFTIGGIMWLTLLLAFGLAALRSEWPMWAGVALLLTCGVLACAVVATVCRPAAERAWWLGFTLFGGGYLALAFQSPWNLPVLPTTRLLNALEPLFHEPRRGPFGGFGTWEGDPYFQVGHCLWTLLLVTLGGLLTSALCAPRRGQTETSGAALAEDVAPESRRWPVLIALGLWVLIVLLTVVVYPRAPELAAGVSYLLTGGLLGVAIAGALLGRGRRRAEWLGAALFGGGYFVLHLGVLWNGPTETTYRAANSVLALARPSIVAVARMLHGSVPVNDGANARVGQKLEQRVDLSFPLETPLEEVMKYIKTATEGPGDEGIPFYIVRLGWRKPR